VYVYGYTYDDVAQMKNMPVGTVKSALFKARQRLREKLKGAAYSMGISYSLDSNDEQED
jgi:DNA-directed RNA polymerase specialized sigma24 family protein